MPSPVRSLPIRSLIRGDEVVGDRVDRDQRGDGHAALAGRPEAGVDRGVGGQVEVGVGQHEHVVLGAAERLHPLAVGGAGLVDVAGDRRRPDERDRLDVGVDQQRVHGLLVAVDHVHHAVRKTGLLPELGDRDRRAGVLLARLDHHRVPAGDGDRDEPQRHHGREVERRDHGDDAEALPDRVDVDAGRGVLGEPALEQVRDAAGELGDLEPAGDLAEGVVEDLAVLAGDQLGDALLVAVEQLAELEQHLRALGERDGAPAVSPRLLGSGDHLVDQVGRGEIECSGDLSGCGVVDVAGAVRGALPTVLRR